MTDDHEDHGEAPSSVDVAVLFADLAGYTALTEAHGDLEAARAATRLFALTDAAYDGPALVVKGMGDGVMVVFAEVAAAVAAGLALVHAVHAEPRFPDLRVGLDAGPVVLRAGDAFGATVNVAARVADLASPGQILATSRVRERLATTDGLEVTERGSARLKHVRDPVDLIELRTATTVRDLPVDPVCRMRVASDAAIQRAHEGRTLRFCSTGCARLFAEHPDAYG